jgi:CTP synthase (UTP-ammonia lyase)
VAESQRIYQAANRERIKERHRELYKMNPEKLREKGRKKM